MSTPTDTKDTINLAELLTPDVYVLLHNAAQEQGAGVRDLVRAAIEDFVAALDDEDATFEETPDEEILADFKQAWHEAMTGQTLPADEALAMLRKKWANEDIEG